MYEVIPSDLYYPLFWGQNLVRPTYMKHGKTSIIHTSIIRGFWDQNLVRQSTADNKGLTLYFLLNSPTESEIAKNP